MRPPKPWEWGDREPQVGDILVYNGQGWEPMTPDKAVSITSTIPSLQRLEEDHDRWVRSLVDRYGPKPEPLPETMTYRTVTEPIEKPRSFWQRLWRWLRGDPQER